MSKLQWLHWMTSFFLICWKQVFLILFFCWSVSLFSFQYCFLSYFLCSYSVCSYSSYSYYWSSLRSGCWMIPSSNTVLNLKESSACTNNYSRESVWAQCSFFPFLVRQKFGSWCFCLRNMKGKSGGRNTFWLNCRVQR